MFYVVVLSYQNYIINMHPMMISTLEIYFLATNGNMEGGRLRDREGRTLGLGG